MADTEKSGVSNEHKSRIIDFERIFADIKMMVAQSNWLGVFGSGATQ